MLLESCQKAASKPVEYRQKAGRKLEDYSRNTVGSPRNASKGWGAFTSQKTSSIPQERCQEAASKPAKSARKLLAFQQLFQKCRWRAIRKRISKRNIKRSENQNIVGWNTFYSELLQRIIIYNQLIQSKSTLLERLKNKSKLLNRENKKSKTLPINYFFLYSYFQL